MAVANERDFPTIYHKTLEGYNEKTIWTQR